MNFTRRKFIAAAVATAVPSQLLRGQTASSGPTILNATDKAGTNLPVVGEGEFTYELTDSWGELPETHRWGNTHNAVQDAQGNFHIHHTAHAMNSSRDSVVILDNKGKFIRSWGREMRGVAHGLWLHQEGNSEYLYLTQQALSNSNAGQPPPELHAAVVKATLNGEIVWVLKGPPEIPEYSTPINGRIPNYNPTNIAIAPNGDIYVADGYGHYYINQYDQNRNYIRSFGGRAPGQNPFAYGAAVSTGVDGPMGIFAEPHGIWVDDRTPNPMLWVTDRRNFRIQRFTLDGKPVDKIVEPFGADRGLPSHFHSRNGYVVVGELQGRVTIFDKENKPVVRLGVAGGRGRGGAPATPGSIAPGHGAIFDQDGNIIVCTWTGNRVTRFRKVS